MLKWRLVSPSSPLVTAFNSGDGYKLYYHIFSPASLCSRLLTVKTFVHVPCYCSERIAEYIFLEAEVK